MLDSGSVTFSNVATGRREVHVKSTFIHFDVPLQQSAALRRAASCPPRLCPCSPVAGSEEWELAMMQELCQAFVPRWERTVDVPPKSVSEPCISETAGELTPTTAVSNEARVDEVASKERQELEISDADGASEASTKESSGAGSPEAPGTPNSPNNGATAQQWISTHRKRTAAVRAGKGAPVVASPRPYGGYQAGGGTDRSSAAKGTGKGLSHFERIEVGIEDDRDFRVVQRLIGPRGKHMQDIVGQCKGAKVWIIGRGSRSWEDSTGPLVVCVGATSPNAFNAATGLVRDLLDRVHEDHRRFRR